MRAAMSAASLALVAAPAFAAEDSHVLQLRSKTAIETAVPHRDAPYVEASGSPEHSSLFTQQVGHQDVRTSCASLCYDQSSGHLEYKPARKFMPDLPGLSPDGISLKKDRINFKYTF
jgi:hypothetical protein